MAPRWSTSSVWASTRRWRRWWRPPGASTSGVAKRQGRHSASTWGGTTQNVTLLSNEPHRVPDCNCSSSLCRSEAFKRGGRPGAQKVMIVITDGESHDSPQLLQAVTDSERDNITMYAIAVSPSPSNIPHFLYGPQTSSFLFFPPFSELHLVSSRFWVITTAGESTPKPF